MDADEEREAEVTEHDEYFIMLERFVHDDRDAMVEALTRLLQFVTVNGSSDPEEQRLFRNDLARAFSYLSRLARDMGFSWRTYDNRIAVIEQPGGPETIGLPLHIDVVPSGEGWHYPAFGGMVEDGVIYGRGTQDDKGPIVQMLFALNALKRLNRPFRRTVRLIIASQEETGDWSDVKSYLEKEPAPDYSIVADAEFPIVNGEKGMVDLKFEIRWPAPAQTASPLNFHSLEGGERSNIVPNRAELIWFVQGGQAQGVSGTFKACLEDFLRENRGADAFPLRVDNDPEGGQKRLHATFMGKSAHGSTPERGHNAILDALRYFTMLPEQPIALVKVARFIAEACESFTGEGLGIAANHDFIGQTTVNLGVLKILPEGAEGILNIRPTHGQTSHEVLETVRNRITEWATANNMEATVRFNAEPQEPLYVKPSDNPELIGALQEAFHRVTGLEARLTAKGGTTFAKAFPNAVGFGPILPGEDTDLMHQADECLSIEQLLRNTKIYARALLHLTIERRQKPRPPKPRGLGLGL